MHQEPLTATRCPWKDQLVQLNLNNEHALQTFTNMHRHSEGRGKDASKDLAV